MLLRSSVLNGARLLCRTGASLLCSTGSLSSTNNSLSRPSALNSGMWGLSSRFVGTATAARKKRRSQSLKDLLTLLTAKVQPTHLFSQYPMVAMENAKALQVLDKFLRAITMKKGYPPASVVTVDFYLAEELKMLAPPLAKSETPKQEEEKENEPRGVPSRTFKLKRVEVIFKTTGGDCRKLAYATLSDFFKRCGLPHKFHWDEEYWTTPTFEEAMREHQQQQEPAT